VLNAQKYAFILKLRNLFNLVIVVSKDNSLIAVVGSYYFNCYRRVCATAVFAYFVGICVGCALIVKALRLLIVR
jgi:hypothetical protein